MDIKLCKPVDIWNHILATFCHFSRISNEQIVDIGKMAAMSLYGKNITRSSSPEQRKLWGWILVYSIDDSMSTKFVQIYFDCLPRITSSSTTESFACLNKIIKSYSCLLFSDYTAIRGTYITESRSDNGCKYKNMLVGDNSLPPTTRPKTKNIELKNRGIQLIKGAPIDCIWIYKLNQFSVFSTIISY